MTTRDGRKWLVLRSWPGRHYVAARADSEFARKYQEEGTVAGSFRNALAYCRNDRVPLVLERPVDAVRVVPVQPGPDLILASSHYLSTVVGEHELRRSQTCSTAECGAFRRLRSRRQIAFSDPFLPEQLSIESSRYPTTTVLRQDFDELDQEAGFVGSWLAPRLPVQSTELTTSFVVGDDPAVPLPSVEGVSAARECE